MKNVRKENNNHGPFQPSGTWVHYLGAHFMQKGLFICLPFMFISNWLLFFKTLNSILGSCTQIYQICHNIIIFDPLLWNFTLFKLLVFFILKFFVRMNIFKCRRLFSSLFSLCSKIHLVGKEFFEFWRVLLVFKWKNGCISLWSTMCILSI